jgi:RNA recognition motif-containing protein
MKLFIGNLDLKATEADLGGMFKRYDSVTSISVMMNSATGEGHGYGYVDMSSDEEAATAIDDLRGARLLDRELMVAAQGPVGRPA